MIKTYCCCCSVCVCVYVCMCTGTVSVRRQTPELQQHPSFSTPPLPHRLICHSTLLSISSNSLRLSCPLPPLSNVSSTITSFLSARLLHSSLLSLYSQLALLPALCSEWCLQPLSAADTVWVSVLSESANKACRKQQSCATHTHRHTHKYGHILKSK